MDEKFELIKQALLEYMREYFDEMERAYSKTLQSKLALLEDSLQDATELSELKVAFEQWYFEHERGIDFEHDVMALWELAISRID
jgi:hypothetical protein